ncbi:MAG: immunoglobulin domain-containing protein [Verrucomicrobia subdivision 3 bacterium]|nr:immunoglobulin domain-containing protein [Limisphaerales bacterium]
MKAQSCTKALLTLTSFTLLLLTLPSQGHAGPGGWDQTYAPTVTRGAVNAMTLQPDGRLLIGGDFTAVNNSSSRSRLARLFADGALDSSFLNAGAGVSDTIWCLAIQADGRIVIGGNFTTVTGTPRNRVARLNSNGTVDGSFIPTNTINISVLAVAAQSDNKVIIGGNFSGGAFPSWNARLNADGTTDTAFSSVPNGAVNAIAVQTDGKILIGGAFTTVNGVARNRIARLNTDGSLDNTFLNGLTGASGIVRCLQIQPDGKILLGGDFTSVNSISRGCVARLNSNGWLDTGFASSPGANTSVYAIAVQPDSSVVIAGTFSTYAAASLSRVARLYADGTRDTTFTNFGLNNMVQALAVQSDGALLAGGTFTTINNTNRSYLGRLYGNLYPPEFLTQPISRATNAGATVTFSAMVNNPTLSIFQWRKDGDNISGAAGMAYVLNNVQPADSGNYSVFVSNAAGGTTSSNAVLNVGIATSITAQPSSLTVTQGQNATFSVAANGTPLKYFWKKGGVFIPGATNAAYTIASVVAGNAATHTCQVSNFLGTVTSAGATLTIYSLPAITVQPVSQIVGVGSNFTVSVTATGNPAPAYQWRKDDLDLAGATASSYRVTAAQTNDSGGYSVVLTNILGGVTSWVVQVSVGDVPAITQAPQGEIVTQGNPVAFNVRATAQSPLAYQWRKDGLPLADATNPTLLFSDVQPSQAGLYSVAVSNGFTSVVSASAALVVVSSIGAGAPGFTGEEFGFGISGPAGLSFVMDASINLTSWQAIATNMFGPGMFLFLDPASSTSAMSFYRVVLP